jgi:hypothetical protein
LRFLMLVHVTLLNNRDTLILCDNVRFVNRLIDKKLDKLYNLCIMILGVRY